MHARDSEILQILFVALSQQFLLIIASRFVKNMQHKKLFLIKILSLGDVFSKFY
jgi:hypothetical protein